MNVEYASIAGPILKPLQEAPCLMTSSNQSGDQYPGWSDALWRVSSRDPEVESSPRCVDFVMWEPPLCSDDISGSRLCSLNHYCPGKTWGLKPQKSSETLNNYVSSNGISYLVFVNHPGCLFISYHQVILHFVSF